MIQNTLCMECKARGQDKVFAHTTINWEVRSCSTWNKHPLHGMQGSRPRQGAYFTLLWTVMEALRFNPWISLPLKILKEMFYLENMCNLITWTSKCFINVLTLSENWKINTFDWSKLFPNRSKKWRNYSQNLYLIWLILDYWSIDWKEHSIGRQEFSTDRDSWN